MLYINKFNSSGDVQTALQNGTLLKPYLAIVGNSVDYNSQSISPNYANDYLTFVFTTSGSISSDLDFYFSKDSGTTWDQGYIEVEEGDEVIAKGDVKQVVNSDPPLNIQGTYSVQGNAMSIYNSTGFTGITEFEDSSHHIKELFRNCTGLTTAENLILPVTSLTIGCYESMFEGCTSLTTAPELPALEAVATCYQRMFSGCTSLNYIKCMLEDPQSSVSNSAFFQWVDSVASTGTFVKNVNATWSQGGSSQDDVPANWTIVNA